jgi:hypothetical protein
LTKISLDLPKSAKLARELGVSHYFTGKPCKNGHLSPREAKWNGCLDCDNMRQKAKRADPKNREHIKALRDADYKRNGAKFKAKKRDRYHGDDRVRIKAREDALKRTKGINFKRYDEILELQEGKCAICLTNETGRKTATLFFVDHDHETGAVRGLVCNACNFLLGQARDNTEILKSAILYLKKTGET